MDYQAMPAGRPTDYKPEYVQTAAELCLNGATVWELAEYFNVCRSTIQRWAVCHPEFRTAIRVGRAHSDDRVEASLYERANGYSHPDVHITSYEGKVTITPIVKHYPPDNQAAFLWLKNRRGDAWKDKQELEHSGTVSLSDRMRGALGGSDGTTKAE